MLNITAVGNLAADPRSNTVGQADVTNFTILVNKKMKDQEYVTAVDCAVWGARAAVAAQYLTKGDRVTVAGDAHAETFERKDGSTGCKIVLRVTDFTLPARPAQQAAPSEAEMAF
ncbi:single-strand binding protein [Synechococcus phage S-CBS3]|uniref:single-strand binding protein n=1 Tax=Synechococcus phage S-CBS3 TaxID=753085 RepID=UPI0002078463|nr:single-strand binding protein [Synechococcus phage S-CBS3]ADF42489.1 single-strand binding protein [Synechococcus phage S-CBS3]